MKRTKTTAAELRKVEKLQQENQHLRDAVNRRKAELEEKNRELKIEAALEKVRAVAMRMKSREDMLLICTVLAQQLAKLGLSEIRNVQTAIFYPEKQSYMNYEYYARHRKTFITDTIYNNHRIAKAFAQKMLRGKGQVSITHLRGRQKVKEWLAYQKTTNVFIDTELNKADSLSYYWHSLGPVALGISTYVPLSKEALELFGRFLRVFELAYRRYLDIEKAGEQAREAQVEAALERIRAAAMAMRDSSALGGIIYKLYGELTKLDARLDRAFIMIVNPENQGITWWMAGYEGLLAENGFFVQKNQHPSHQLYLENCRQRKKKWTYLFEGKEKRDWDRFGFSKTELARLPEPIKKFMAAQKRVYLSGSSDQFGSLVTGSFEPLPPEQQDIISRFAIVFNQAYTRFLDLQKAEEQAREAEIQLALERVRARSLAMHHTTELQDVINIVAQQLLSMNIDMNGGVFMTINAEVDKDLSIWAAAGAANYAEKAVVPYFDNPIITSILEAVKRGPGFVELSYPDEIKIAFFRHLFRYPPWKSTSAAWKKELLSRKGGYTRSVAVSRYTSIGMTNHHGRRFTKAENGILRRFGNVLEQSYTRFLDLQKAEAQAREAQIEAGLEKVRGRSMAMHKSEELKEVIRLVLEQLVQLGIKAEHAGFYIDYQNQDDMHIWLADPNIEPFFAILPYFDTPTWNSFLEAKKKGITLHTDLLDFEEKNKFYQNLFERFEVPEKAREFYMQCKGLAVSTVLLETVGLYIENFSADPYSEEENEVLLRFARVFQQAYTRFLDLQKAEAQAREAQIEAALERVRSRTMIMQQSRELNETAELLYRELGKLGISIFTCGYVLVDEKTDTGSCYMANPEGSFTFDPFRVSQTGNLVFRSIYQSWKNKESYCSIRLEGEENIAHNRYLAEESDKFPLPVDLLLSILPPVTVSNSFNFNSGYLLVVSLSPYTNEQNEVMVRFTKVFEQTYTRFLDLQKAEAQAREAEIELALERVRSKTMAMHSSQDVETAVFTLFDELLRLGIDKSLRCGIGVLQDRDHLELWTATSGEGNKVVLYKGKLDMEIHPMLLGVRDAWENKASTYSYLLEGADLINYYTAINAAPEYEFRIDIAQLPPKLVHSDFFFPEGTLFTFTLEPIAESDQRIFKRFAAVFGQTYRRFLDLQQAEALALQAEIDLVRLKEEKKKTEEALAELRNTQNQLVQAEKMASLGELTAGIAHEIQNPLNFVNNFSEVSRELLEEMQSEMERGNLEDAREIMQDVIQNLEKINHHGKRADGIVKGMLQHSRSGSGQKEFTDINGLCDEYLRLSYHGLRAKDKSFNAKFETDFDAAVGKLEIVPQDIGRVILNLINNAFFAVTQRLAQSKAEKNRNAVTEREELGAGSLLLAASMYEPTVSIHTKKTRNTIEIRIADNGNGIPQNILEKIFQPFFTTKPTGQGTGLGLSLSYDIVKAHGGELKVETKEGEGTEFIIQLPIVR